MSIPGPREVQSFKQIFNRVVGGLEEVLIGKTRVIRLAVTTLFAGGHLLLEDVPGTGKTLLAVSLAQAIGGTSARIQCTADLLPGDITGVSVYDPRAVTFRFHEGPVFANLVLADEINRASPRAQSALLEVMEERQVSIDGVTRPVPDPFLLIATQNPVEHVGTAPLPEAQLDRFLIRTSVGYPDRAAALRILSGERQTVPSLVQVTTVRQMILLAQTVHVDPAILDYVIRLCERTRTAPELRLGASVRAMTALVCAARVWALSEGRAYVVPDDVRDLVPSVLGHRLALAEDAAFDGIRAEAVLANILLHEPCPETAGPT